MTFVFGVMIEFTICHFAKNQELSRGTPNQPNLIVDSTLSTLFDTTSSTNDSLKRLKLNKAEARERFFKNLDPPNKIITPNGRALRADEPDIHTIQMDLEPMLVKSFSGDSYNSNSGADARLLGFQGNNYEKAPPYSLDTVRLTEEKNLRPAVNKLKNQVRRKKLLHNKIVLKYGFLAKVVFI